MLYTYGLCPLLEGSRTNIIWFHTLMVPFASLGDLISFKLPEKVHFLKWVLAKLSNFDHSKFAKFLMQKWSFLNDFKQKWQFLSFQKKSILNDFGRKWRILINFTWKAEFLMQKAEFLTQKWSFLNDFKQKWQFLSFPKKSIFWNDFGQKWPILINFAWNAVFIFDKIIRIIF